MSELLTRRLLNVPGILPGRASSMVTPLSVFPDRSLTFTRRPVRLFAAGDAGESPPNPYRAPAPSSAASVIDKNQ